MDNPVPSLEASASRSIFCQGHFRTPGPMLSSPFCKTCLRNQAIVREILAVPPFSTDTDKYSDKRRHLESRYPPVCSRECQQMLDRHLEIKNKV